MLKQYLCFNLKKKIQLSHTESAGQDISTSTSDTEKMFQALTLILSLPVAAPFIIKKKINILLK